MFSFWGSMNVTVFDDLPLLVKRLSFDDDAVLRIDDWFLRMPRGSSTCPTRGTPLLLLPPLSSAFDGGFAKIRFCSRKEDDDDDVRDEGAEGMNGLPVVNDAALLIKSVALLSLSCCFCCCNRASVVDESVSDDAVGAFGRGEYSAVVVDSDKRCGDDGIVVVVVVVW